MKSNTAQLPNAVPMLIAGNWCEGAGGSTELRDKFSGKTFARIGVASRDQVRAAVSAVKKGFLAAARDNLPGPYERGAILDKAALAIDVRREQLTLTMQAEAGFTRADAEGEINRCMQTLRLCAEEARRLTGEMVPMEGAPGQSGRMGLTLRIPLGVVCAITPFNSPLNTLAHKLGPAFAAGNSFVLKPSMYTPLSANLLVEALLEAGLPPGFAAVVQGGEEVGRWLLEEEDIAFYAFTGSTRVGRAIQAGVGLRRSQMELGSIAHTIVDADADLDRALPKIVGAAYRKAGQVCTSIQLLLVHKKLFGVTVERLQTMVEQLKFGDPREPGCIVGPLIDEAAAQRVEAWVDEAVAAGARKIVGGPRQGRVMPPVLLLDTRPDMKVRNCEIFGPVLSVQAFEDFDDALDLVNNTPYGLAAGVFTNRLDHALRAARGLRAGAVHINEASSSRADLMPFGGSKDSGFGREGPRYAVREMSEERLVTLLS